MTELETLQELFKDVDTDIVVTKMNNEKIEIIKKNFKTAQEKIDELLELKKQNHLKKFEFTSCEDCIHKTEVYALECGECRHFYGCLFEKRKEYE